MVTFLIDGEEISTASEQRFSRVAPARRSPWFFSILLCFRTKTVVGNVEYGLKVRGVPRSERRDRAVESVGPGPFAQMG